MYLCNILDHESAQKTRVNRKARLVIRNIPYKIKDNQLRAYFEKFGKVLEVCTLKRSDGKLVGVAFVQFENVEEASKAVEKSNGHELMGRTLEVAFAVSKQDFVKKPVVKQEIKSEIEEEDAKEAPKKKRKLANDAEDGHTIFVKNLNFDTTDEEFSESMKQFGPHHYALITRESVSRHSKGTGFVRYKNKESADLCLQNSGKIVLKDFTLEMLPAMNRNEAKKLQSNETEKAPKDTRNLYLLKEGVILAGSPAAEGVSAPDMSKRLYLERMKSQMLKNLNRFIAIDRLTVHNLPENLTDGNFRKIVNKQTNVNPKECRVMRENKPSMGAPLGRSKGFGFLSFTNHEDALKVLRKLNNNPSIFGKNTRPIVSFSIEDKKAINLKQKRLEKSKLQNPTYQAKLERLKEQNTPGKFVLLKKPDPSVVNMMPKVSVTENDYSGLVAKEGVTRIRSKSKLDAQAEKHSKNANKRRKDKKKKKQQKEIQKDKAEMRVPKKKSDVKDNFVDLYKNYKQLFASSAPKATKLTKKKWYDETV